MAHARRKYFEAQSSDIMRSTVMLAYFHLLYDVEREAREKQLGTAERLALVRYAQDGDLEIDNNGADAASGIGAVMPRSGLCRARSGWQRPVDRPAPPTRHNM